MRRGLIEFRGTCSNDFVDFYSRHIAPQVKKVIGSDLSRHLLEFAKNKPIDNIEFVRAESSELPFEDSSFDIVFSRLSFNHIHHRIEVLHEMRRVCKRKTLPLKEPHHAHSCCSWRLHRSA